MQRELIDILRIAAVVGAVTVAAGGCDDNTSGTDAGCAGCPATDAGCAGCPATDAGCPATDAGCAGCAGCGSDGG